MKKASKCLCTTLSEMSWRLVTVSLCSNLTLGSINHPWGTGSQHLETFNGTQQQNDKKDDSAFRVPSLSSLCWATIVIMSLKWSDSCVLIIPASRQRLQPPRTLLQSAAQNSQLRVFSPLLIQSSEMRLRYEKLMVWWKNSSQKAAKVTTCSSAS